MRKILLSIFIMIFGFQGAAISAESIDMDSGNALKMQVKVEALREVLNNYPKDVSNVAEYCFEVIPKDKFLEDLYDIHMNRPDLGLSLEIVLLECNNWAYKSCETGSKHHNSGEICFEFLHDIVEQHNKLVKQETQKELQQKKIYTSESEYYETLNKKGVCVYGNSTFSFLNTNIRTLNKCKEYCKNFAIANACSLQYIILYKDGGCQCFHDIEEDSFLLRAQPYYFIPNWEDYVKLYNLDR